MKEKIKNLLELQELDIKIHSIRDELKDVPEKLDSLNSKLSSDEQKINNIKNQVSDLDSEVSSLQNQTSDVDSMILKLEEKLFSINSSKEFEALQKETGDLKRKKIEIENEELKIMEQIESSNKSLEVLVSKFNDEVEPLKVEIEKLELEVKSSDSRINTIETQRIEVAKNVDKELLQIYDSLLIHRTPVAVEAKDGMCGHCFMRIPPQTYIKVLELNEIVLCPSCKKKILIPDLG